MQCKSCEEWYRSTTCAHSNAIHINALRSYDQRSQDINDFLLRTCLIAVHAGMSLLLSYLIEKIKKLELNV